MSKAKTTFAASPRSYQARLEVPDLDPVPLQWLHLTVQGVGFT
ncbi:MAG: hypothetical protein ACRDTT_28105 [Pseudonocardiaceae bacterium]